MFAAERNFVLSQVRDITTERSLSDTSIVRRPIVTGSSTSHAPRQQHIIGQPIFSTQPQPGQSSRVSISSDVVRTTGKLYAPPRSTSFPVRGAKLGPAGQGHLLWGAASVRVANCGDTNPGCSAPFAPVTRRERIFGIGPGYLRAIKGHQAAFSRRTRLNFFLLFFTAMNLPSFLSRFAQAVLPINFVLSCDRLRAAPLRALSPTGLFLIVSRKLF